MGIKRIDADLEDFLIKNYHTLLIEDEAKRSKLKSYIDVNLIPKEFKTNKIQYLNYEKIDKFIYPKTMLKQYSKIVENKELVEKLKCLYDLRFSPLLADTETLKKQPKTFLSVCGQDPRKDEGLIYCERLTRAGVNVDLFYYAKSMHNDFLSKKSIAKQMKKDFLDFIRANV
jgi:acetyl esterase/lipase